MACAIKPAMQQRPALYNRLETLLEPYRPHCTCNALLHTISMHTSLYIDHQKAAARSRRRRQGICKDVYELHARHGRLHLSPGAFSATQCRCGAEAGAGSEPLAGRFAPTSQQGYRHTCTYHLSDQRLPFAWGSSATCPALDCLHHTSESSAPF